MNGLGIDGQEGRGPMVYPPSRLGGARAEVRPHTYTLLLTDREADKLQADARVVGVTDDQLLSLVVAFSCRARINHASCLALANITDWREDSASR